MVDWRDHAGRTVGLGFGVGILLFVIHILLWLVDQVGNPVNEIITLYQFSVHLQFFVRKCCFTVETQPDDDEVKGLKNMHLIAQNMAA